MSGGVDEPPAEPPSTARVERFTDLAAQIRALPPSCGPLRLVAVDGPGGAGKSTFAARLVAALGPDIPAVHTDDFAQWEQWFDWFPRLVAQVVEPLRHGVPGRYQRYDWATRELAEWHDVPLAPVVVIEGVGAARREIADALALVVWIETPMPLWLARGLNRDGEGMSAFWERWIEAEDLHYSIDRTRERANLVVSGNPSVRHAPEREYVVG